MIKWWTKTNNIYNTIMQYKYEKRLIFFSFILKFFENFRQLNFLTEVLKFF